MDPSNPSSINNGNMTEYDCGPLSSEFFLCFWAIKFKFSFFVNYETTEKTTQFCFDDWQTIVTD